MTKIYFICKYKMLHVIFIVLCFLLRAKSVLISRLHVENAIRNSLARA
jgi:hypothetical protein